MHFLSSSFAFRLNKYPALCFAAVFSASSLSPTNGALLGGTQLQTQKTSSPRVRTTARWHSYFVVRSFDGTPLPPAQQQRKTERPKTSEHTLIQRRQRIEYDDETRRALTSAFVCVQTNVHTFEKTGENFAYLSNLCTVSGCFPLHGIIFSFKHLAVIMEGRLGMRCCVVFGK